MALLLGMQGSHDGKKLAPGIASPYRPARLQSQLAASLGYESQISTVR
ncbi:hypothetical protein [Paraburkholderia sediminicola]